jgi:hypothetical protein
VGGRPYGGTPSELDTTASSAETIMGGHYDAFMKIESVDGTRKRS